jgi:hypothetical protein
MEALPQLVGLADVTERADSTTALSEQTDALLIDLNSLERTPSTLAGR